MTIKDNLQRLIQLVKDHPKQNLNLDQFKTSELTCGTCYCSAGLAATDAQFLKRAQENCDIAADFLTLANFLSEDAKTFGTNPWNRLFERAGHGAWDGAIIAQHRKMTAQPITHKQLALARLEKQLALYEGE
jgi:hypothetical protein